MLIKESVLGTDGISVTAGGASEAGVLKTHSPMPRSRSRSNSPAKILPQTSEPQTEIKLKSATSTDAIGIESLIIVSIFFLFFFNVCKFAKHY